MKSDETDPVFSSLKKTMANERPARYLEQSSADARLSLENLLVPKREVIPVRSLSLTLTAFALACLAPTVSSSSAKIDKIKALIITGANNHDWKATTEILKSVIEEDGKVSVDIEADPEAPIFSDAKKLAGYDLIVLNLNQGKRWASDREKNFLNYVREGGGLVVYHAADNAFSGWDEYDKLVGGTWRSKGTSFPQKGTFHPKYGPFEVTVVDSAHPITKGVSHFNTTDELYSNLKLQDNIHVLAQGMTEGKPQPLLFVSEYGNGKMFQTALGHDVNAMKTPQFRETLKRGVIWAARSK